MIILLYREIEKCLFSLYVLNMDISVTIAPTYFKFRYIALDICMEGTVSQIFDIVYSFYFIKCRNVLFKKYQTVSLFLS